MEAYVPGGAMLPSADHAARAFAEAFARLIRLAPRPAEVSTLDPAPSWAAWNHAEDGLWPCPEDPDVNLNEVAGPEWIDDPGRRARDRLRASESEAVIGHCDWLAGNLGWSGDALLVVHDWDSMTADSEAVLVGFAAALYSAVSADELATVEDTGRFLVAYCHARGREFSADELERSWAAGVWTRACDAKYQHAVGQPITSLRESEARELVTDNLRNQMRTICRIRPAGMAQQLRTLRAVSGEQARHAPFNLADRAHRPGSAAPDPAGAAGRAARQRARERVHGHDLLLVAVTAGLREMLGERGECPDGLVLRASVRVGAWPGHPAG